MPSIGRNRAELTYRTDDLPPNAGSVGHSRHIQATDGRY
jgi:hypothetical protein